MRKIVHYFIHSVVYALNLNISKGIGSYVVHVHNPTTPTYAGVRGSYCLKYVSWCSVHEETKQCENLNQ